MEQRNLQSTKLYAPLPLSTSLDVDPSQEPQNKATHNLFALLLPTSDLCKSYSGQNGRFPIQSWRGYQYVFNLYEYDSNAILSKPLKTRQAMDITTAWTKLHNKLLDNGFSPTLRILDNECSHVMKQAFAKHSVNFQFVPPRVHRQTPPSAPSRPGRTTSALGSQPAIQNSLSPNGTGSCLKRISHSTFYGLHGAIQKYWPTPASTRPSTF
jgi:hypothetical protein